MELWIRSQDRDYLEKVEKIYLWENSFKEYQIDGKSELGTYKTKKRALEVLDEIQKIIGWLQIDMKHITVGDCKNLKGGFEDYVYEMPKE